MTLLVSIIAKDEHFNTEELEAQLSSPHNDLFGFESLRQSLWGHPIMAALQCELLYSLKEGNIYAFDEDVLKLKLELILVSNNIATIAQQTGYEATFISFRIANALAAVEIVELNLEKAGIAIW